MNSTKLKACLDGFIAKNYTPGLDCIVYKDHDILFRYTAGMDDVESAKPLSSDALYLIFSMTKMLTCVAALQLYEKGKFSLDDDISMYIPEFAQMKLSDTALDLSAAADITTGGSMGNKADNTGRGYAVNPITVKQLFTMSAGLDYSLNDEPITNALKAGKCSTVELVKAMSNKTLSFEPGTHFQYSLCHDVLGALVEIWSGKSFGDYMTENIFKPLGMKNTFFGIPEDKERLSRMVALYKNEGACNPVKIPLECPYILSKEYQSGGAGLVSNTEDYAVFLDALACGGVSKNGYRLLESKTVELMSQNHLSGRLLDDFFQLRKGYGYGFGVRTHINALESGSKSPLGEYGWDGAAGSFSMVDPVNRISLTYFQHVHNWDLAMHEELRNTLYECLDA